MKLREPVYRVTVRHFVRKERLAQVLQLCWYLGLTFRYCWSIATGDKRRLICTWVCQTRRGYHSGRYKDCCSLGRDMTPCSLVDGISPVGCPQLRLTSSFFHISLHFVSSHTPHTATVEGRGGVSKISFFLRYFGNPFFPVSNPRLSLLVVIHLNFCVVGCCISSIFEISLLNNTIKCCV